MIVKIDEDRCISLSLLDTILDVSRVKSYTAESKADGKIVLKFYDERGRVIKPYKRKKR